MQQGLLQRLRSSVPLAPAEVFRQADMMGRGYLDVVAFERFLLMYMGSVSQPDVQSLWRIVDPRGTGRVNLQDFSKLFSP
mmetsp:Transcript_39121/g.125790  ORF Transcript_39121/g.125790 Transcript_39121/m.125790 type:complete len:80 (-) Transcript_39121:192-431(-)